MFGGRIGIRWISLEVHGGGGALIHRRVQEIKEIANILRLGSDVERPTYDQIKAIGVTIESNKGVAIFRHPETFNIRDAQ